MHDLIKTLRLKCAPYSMAEFIEKLDTKNYVCIEGLVKKHKGGGVGGGREHLEMWLIKNT